MYEELGEAGLDVITVALDRDPADARPFIEAAAPRHPSLIDTEHRVAHLFGWINVPTVVWIDEQGRIVRAAAMEYGTDTFKQFHGRESAPFLEAIRVWVREGRVDVPAERQHTLVPTQAEQQGRAEFSLAWHLHKKGRRDAAERHFVRAGELAPHDWTIRRGSMPIRGKNPMGPEFFELYKEWEASGKPGYESLASEREQRDA